MGILSMKEKVLLIVVGLLVIALGAVTMYYKAEVALLEHSISEKNKKIGELEVDVAKLEKANQDLAAAIEKQNAKIKELLAASANASAEADAAIKKAKEDAKKWKAQYDALFNAPRPTNDDCQDLSVVIDKYLDMRKQEVTK